MIPATNQALDRDPVEIACETYDSALASYAEGKADQAESLFLRALHLLEQAEGPDSPDVAQVLINLAVIDEDRCEYGAAEQFYERSVRIMEQTVDTGDADIERLRVQSWSGLGAIHRTQGKYGQAGELFRRAL